MAGWFQTRVEEDSLLYYQFTTLAVYSDVGTRSRVLLWIVASPFRLPPQQNDTIRWQWQNDHRSHHSVTVQNISTGGGLPQILWILYRRQFVVIPTLPVLYMAK